MGIKKAYISLTVFLLAFMLACILCLLVNYIPTPVIVVTPASTQEALSQTAQIPSDTPPAITLSPIPTPFTDIIVWVWRDIRPGCINDKREFVIITGLEISGGVPPYKFQFTQNDKLIYSEVISLPRGHPFKNEIQFSESILVSTGSPVYVRITSTSLFGNPAWEGDLFYKWEDETC